MAAINRNERAAKKVVIKCRLEQKWNEFIAWSMKHENSEHWTRTEILSFVVAVAFPDASHPMCLLLYSSFFVWAHPHQKKLNLVTKGQRYKTYFFCTFLTLSLPLCVSVYLCESLYFSIHWNKCWTCIQTRILAYLSTASPKWTLCKLTVNAPESMHLNQP